MDSKMSRGLDESNCVEASLMHRPNTPTAALKPYMND
jgi:hypothetical protein